MWPGFAHPWARKADSRKPPTIPAAQPPRYIRANLHPRKNVDFGAVAGTFKVRCTLLYTRLLISVAGALPARRCESVTMKDISYIAAFPKSGITYLNFMLFHILFDRPQDVRLIDSDYIFDVHESLARVPPSGAAPRYAKIHFSYSPRIPLRERASRAVYLLRDPIDVMMSVWDFKHLTGEDGLLEASPADRAALFQRFCQHWVTTGGLIYPWAGSWKRQCRFLARSRRSADSRRPLRAAQGAAVRGVAADSELPRPRGNRSAHRGGHRSGQARQYAQARIRRDRQGVFPAFSIGRDWRKAMPRATASWGGCMAGRRKNSSVRRDGNMPSRFSAR